MHSNIRSLPRPLLADMVTLALLGTLALAILAVNTLAGSALAQDHGSQDQTDPEHGAATATESAATGHGEEHGEGHGGGPRQPGRPAAAVDRHPLRGHPAVDRPLPAAGAALLAPPLPEGLARSGPLRLRGARSSSRSTARRWQAIIHIYRDRLHPVHHPAVGAVHVAGGIYVGGTCAAPRWSTPSSWLWARSWPRWIGTTGAAMVMIRRCCAPTPGGDKVHIIIFFIFLVANVGGSLTPAGRSAAVPGLPARRAVLLGHHRPS